MPKYKNELFDIISHQILNDLMSKKSVDDYYIVIHYNNHTPFTKLRELDETALLVILYNSNNFIDNNFNKFLLKIIDKINDKIFICKRNIK